MWKKIVMGIFIALSALVGFGAAKVQVTFNNSLNQISRDYDTRLENVDLSGIKVNSDNDIVNILVIGNDARKDVGYQNDVGLTDTMIIATMDLKHNALKTTSLMRDCYVEIPGHGHNKLNSAYSFGGIELLYKTIATNFDIKLDGYVEIGLSAFVDIVDAVGGVDVEVTESEAEYLNSTNYIRKKKDRNVKVGKQTLNGQQALGYCRIRKKGTTANGLRDDYGRTWRQRTVMAGVFSKVKSLPMPDWVKIANKVLKHVRTDLDNDQILGYITDVVTMGTTEIHQLQIPINGYYRSAFNGEVTVGSCLMMTDGNSSTYTTGTNAEALNSFVFDYDGKNNFKFGTFENKE